MIRKINQEEIIINAYILNYKASTYMNQILRELKGMPYDKYLAAVLRKRKKSAERTGSNARLFLAWP